MKRRPAKPKTSDPFEAVRIVGLALPNVEAATRYDGSPKPGTLVVRVGFEERALLLEEAPETYYVTDFYRSNPIVLARL
jgi:hypothetical protein